MSLDVGTALREGGRRTFERDGLILVFAFVLIGLVSAVATQTILADLFDSYIEFLRANQGTGPEEFTREEIEASVTFSRGLTPFALSIPVSVAWLLVAVTVVVAEAATLVAVRVFFTEYTDEISFSVIRRNITVATVNGIIGGIVVKFIVAIGGILGLVALVVGGPIVALFLAISFLFFRQEIAVEDKTFVDAMADSWQLAGGNRIELFTLVLVLGIIGFLVSLPAFVLGFFSPIASAIAMIPIGAMAAFGTASVTRAYAQLHAERAGDEQGDTDDEWKY